MKSPFRFKDIFFDLDHTLWDFEANSYATLQQIFTSNELHDRLSISYEIFHRAYSIHNTYFWDQYGKGQISQSDLKWKRMYVTLQAYGLDDLDFAKKISQEYLEVLPTSTKLFPHTKELLIYLKSKAYHLHIISNGFEAVQHHKLACSGINTYFNHIITSEKSQYAKPDRKIFDYAISMANASLHESIMIGDNPEADLQGALNAGMQSVYVDHQDQATSVYHTYRVGHLKEIEHIL